MRSSSGAPGTRVLAGSIETAREWGLDHEVLDAAEVTARFPALRPPDGHAGALRAGRRAGRPEARGGRTAAPAAAAGAELRHDEAVPVVAATGDGVRVQDDAAAR